jgi:hypothetical protein
MAPQVPVSEYGSGFWRSVIWWRIDWLRPVGSTPLESFIKPIRNRAESVELHFWETTIW